MLPRDGLIDKALADVGFPGRPAMPVAETVTYAHLPLLVGEDRKKLSKRHASVRAVAKHFKGAARHVLEAAEVSLARLDEWTGEKILSALDGVALGLGIGRGKAFQPVRVAVTGTDISPPLPETLALLDPAVVRERLRHALDRCAAV